MRTIGVKLTADTSGYISGLARAGAATKDFTGQMDKAAKTGHLDKVADQAAKFGIAGVAAFGLVVKSAADFDKQMSAVSAATHANTQDMSALRAAALQAGKDTQYSATEAAKGITELSKAGVSTADVLNGGLKGALSLAAAGQLDVGEAAETAASALTQFKLKGDQVPHVADLLAAAAGKAQGSVHDLGYALSQSGLVASQMGLSIEDATGTLAAFASAGLIGSDAGTSFKTMMLALQNPAEKTSKLMGKMGIDAYDAGGNFVGIAKFAGILQDQLKDLSPEIRQATLAQMFGNDAVRAGTILYNQGAAGIEKWIKQTNEAGFATSTAAKLTDNLSGDIERLKGSLETLAISSGSGSNSGLRVLSKSLNSLVGQFLELPSVVTSSATVLVGLGGATALGLAGFVKMRKGVAEAVTQLNAMGPMGERSAAGLGRVASAAGKVTLAFAALEAASAVIHHFQTDLNPQTDALALGLKDYAQSGRIAGEASRLLGGDLGDLAHGFKFLADGDNSRRAAVKNFQQGLEALPIGLDGANQSLTKTAERVTAVDSALAQMVQGGQTQQASAAFQALAAKLAVGGVSMDEFRKQFPAYAAAVEVANHATTDTTGAIQSIGHEARLSAEDIKDLAKAAEEFISGQLSADRAAIAFRNGVESLNKELKSGSRTLSLNSVEGRKNRSAVLDQIATLDELRQSRVNQNETLDVANRKYIKDIDGLRKSMLQAGFSKKAVDELLGSYKRLPPSVDTKVGAPGADTSTKKVKDYNFAIGQLPKKANLGVTVTGDAAAYAKIQRLLVAQEAAQKGISISAANAAFNKNSRGFAEGGWTGPGTTYQPAGVVHADEFVVQKSSRQKFESSNPGALDHLNRTGEMPGYAGGGVVWPFKVDASKTLVMSMQDALSKVAAAGLTGGGQTYKAIEAIARGRFPGIQVISDVRPGARTLSGNLSYHGFGRAVDFAPSRPLAQFFHDNYMSRLKELITPYNDLNVWNGRPHRYTGAIWNQHNFAGGNAHDHVAMAGGGVIGEPVFGVGASGRTYSFAENGPERVLPTYATASHGAGGGGGGNVYQITINPTPLAHPRDIGREVVGAIQAYESGSGRTWRTGRNAK